MTYDEFWLKDYRLIESYIKKREMDIERETAFNWEMATLLRQALLEIASTVLNDPKKGGKPYEFPKRPESRTHIGQLNEKRNKQIDAEIKDYYNELFMRRKEKSDEND